jgi:hypothetical protein
MRYPLENQEVELGGRTVKINGFATYEVEGNPCHFARFTKVKILDWTFIVTPFDPKVETGLTKEDLNALQDSILDNLNENYELCDYLAGEYLS